MKNSFVILLISIFSISILLSGCGQETKTILEDLSAATPTTFIAIDESTEIGRSYVKLTQQNETSDISQTSEDTKDEETMEKRVYREGDLVSFDPIGVDPDGDVITYTFSRPLDEKGKWQTDIGDVGTYQITITASDGKSDVEKRVILLILSANRAPSIDGLEDMTVVEGNLVVLKPKIFDYNGDEVVLEYSKPFDQDGEWQTDYDDSGTYLIKVSVSDNETTVEKQITIVVTDTNRAPVLGDISHISVFAGDLITLEPTAADPDGDLVTFSFSGSFSSDGSWQTTEADVGTYTTTVTASDGTLDTEKLVSIILNHKNQAPIVIMDSVRAEETDRIVLKPTIVDPEGDAFTVTYSEPFDSSGVWVTDYDDSGQYTVTITATDDDGAVGTLTVSVTVYDKNRAPVFKI
ncbi:MAG: hypothetical protein AABX82_05850 [Nanoarchaeota archaeon]